MIGSGQELKATLERIVRFQAQLEFLNQVEKNSSNLCAAASGFKYEIERMRTEMEEYLNCQ